MSAKKKTWNSRELVLAEGEATGHFHAILEQKGAELYEENGILYLHVEEDTELTHQEHKTVMIPPGDYRVGRVYEYDHFKDLERVVSD